MSPNSVSQENTTINSSENSNIPGIQPFSASSENMVKESTSNISITKEVNKKLITLKPNLLSNENLL